MLAKGLTLLSLAFCMAAHSGINCPNIFQRSFIADTYYVLTFVGSSTAMPTSPEAKLWQAKRGQLESNVTPKLQDYVLKIAKRISANAPTIILLTCDFPMGASDLTRTDLAKLTDRNVLATLWSSNEDEKASVVYVSLPHYQRRTGNRREVEVAWLRAVVSTDALDDWSKELSRNSTTQQALLALAIGFAAVQQQDWRLAKLSLCQARSNLRLLGPETVRPAPEELQRDLAQLLKEAIAQVDDTARQNGLNLDAVLPIKLACAD